MIQGYFRKDSVPCRAKSGQRHLEEVCCKSPEVYVVTKSEEGSKERDQGKLYGRGRTCSSLLKNKIRMTSQDFE